MVFDCVVLAATKPDTKAGSRESTYTLATLSYFVSRLLSMRQNMVSGYSGASSMATSFTVSNMV